MVPASRRECPGFSSEVYRRWLSCGACGSQRTPLLKAFTAVYRSALGRPKRNRCFFSALRTNRLGFYALGVSRTRPIALSAIGLACLAPFGLILEASVREEHLLARGEYELSAAFAALQYFVVIFHMLLPGPSLQRSGSGTARARRRRLSTQTAVDSASRLAPDCLD
jgi:hypothetical protein